MGAGDAEQDRRDASLARAACDGDARAFESLLDRHQGRVLRVLRYMGVRPEDRDDVAQDVFVRIFRHLPGYRPGRPFRSWVYRIAVNAAHDHRARAGRQPASTPVDALPEPIAGPASAPGADADRRALRAVLERAMDALTDRERAVFVLREIEGLDTPTVARALGITRITVRRHLGRARERLQREIAGDKGFSGS